MSVQAMTWALEQRLVRDASARHVLLCLANYADRHGRNAFPSAGSLVADTGLSERTVRAKIDLLLELGAIRLGNQAIAKAHIERVDRRPVCYDLAMTRGADSAPRSEGEEGAGTGCSGCTSKECTGCNLRQSGVQSVQERGAATAPEPSLNHQGTEEQHAHVDAWQRFAMFEAWQPDPEQLAPQLRLAQLPPEAATDDTRRAFVAHYLALPKLVENSAGWSKRYAKWLKREQAMTSGASHDQTTTGGSRAAAGIPLADNLNGTDWVPAAPV